MNPKLCDNGSCADNTLRYAGGTRCPSCHESSMRTVIVVQPEAVAETMLIAKKAGLNAGWSEELLDTLENFYGLESAVQKAVGIEAEQYSSTYTPGSDSDD